MNNAIRVIAETHELKDIVEHTLAHNGIQGKVYFAEGYSSAASMGASSSVDNPEMTVLVVLDPEHRGDTSYLDYMKTRFKNLRVIFVDELASIKEVLWSS